eukprot:CAMPEP_0201621564 /NCGR_PEP_ID=MMETSP0492-20130828/46947_1 /ASSEMBLY_ACC=CAM_ASM_000837 /TAXON_ID=420259 /ORGANISM="Thalassiosira gravida, Strain GMp14c1" /LENGTH=74 /DNA_ID=CAMNT_0048091113 /DNA_START=1566 /DNA_END=1790 /DNA_ORIENTATION=+
MCDASADLAPPNMSSKNPMESGALLTVLTLSVEGPTVDATVEEDGATNADDGVRRMAHANTTEIKTRSMVDQFD